jgi:phosphoribosylaminoimidazolecarboxamide formyltransferase/IMP cyclohydrolase
LAQKFALISVSDKTGVVELARALVQTGYTVLSTGGTARALVEGGVEVLPVERHTGAPEMMDGRVKTLHPRIHGGILGDRERHAAEGQQHDISWIDVVVVNLYPFEKVVGAGGVSWEEAIENIDIGGPTMVRAAAKNHRHVTVVVDPADYGRVAEAIRAGGTSDELRRELAIRAFRHTARYDAVISGWLAQTSGDSGFPTEQALGLRKVQDLRYGENPHQQAAFYGDSPVPGARDLSRLVQHQGKELSFNNLADLDAAVRAVFELDGFEIEGAAGCVIVKHNNPCGASSEATLPLAFAEALAGDPVSAYGGILAFNKLVDEETVAAVKQSKTFFEVVVAPAFTPGALERLKTRENLRVVELPAGWATGRPPGRDARRVQGGWLLQDWDVGAEVGWTVAGRRPPTPEEERGLRFAWALCRSVKSNAIVLARPTASGSALNGVGAGQMSRVDSVKLAVGKATRPVPGCAMASDAFFPFPDGVQAAAQAGVTAVIQPGGSIRDPEVIAVADAANMAMIFTGTRHFRH